MPTQLSPQAMLPRASNVNGSTIRQPYTNGKPIAMNFIPLPAQPCRQVKIINDQGASGADIVAKRTNETIANNYIKIVGVDSGPKDSYTFDVNDASDISVAVSGATNASAAIQFTIECKL